MSESGDGGPGKGQLGLSFVERKRAELTARLKGRDLSKRFRTSSEGSPGSNAALGAFFFIFVATPERVQGYVFIYDYKSSSLYCARAKRSFKSAMLSIVD